MNVHTVKMGELYVTDQSERMSTFGVGSCVVIILFDTTQHIAGMTHAMLSEQNASTTQIATHPLRYITHAINALLEEMEKKGARRAHMHAHLIGGAQMFAVYGEQSEPIGITNAITAHAHLDSLHIPIETNDTGGTEGRNVHYAVDTGELQIDTRSTMMKDS